MDDHQLQRLGERLTVALHLLVVLAQALELLLDHLLGLHGLGDQAHVERVGLRHALVESRSEGGAPCFGHLRRLVDDALGCLTDGFDTWRLTRLGRQHVDVRLLGVEERLGDVDVGADDVAGHLEARVTAGVASIDGVLLARLFVEATGVVDTSKPALDVLGLLRLDLGDHRVLVGSRVDTALHGVDRAGFVVLGHLSGLYR